MWSSSLTFQTNAPIIMETFPITLASNLIMSTSSSIAMSPTVASTETSPTSSPTSRPPNTFPVTQNLVLSTRTPTSNAFYLNSYNIAFL